MADILETQVFFQSESYIWKHLSFIRNFSSVGCLSLVTGQDWFRRFSNKPLPEWMKNPVVLCIALSSISGLIDDGIYPACSVGNWTTIKIYPVYSVGNWTTTVVFAWTLMMPPAIDGIAPHDAGASLKWGNQHMSAELLGDILVPNERQAICSHCADSIITSHESNCIWIAQYSF